MSKQRRASSLRAVTPPRWDRKELNHRHAKGSSPYSQVKGNPDALAQSYERAPVSGGNTARGCAVLSTRNVFKSCATTAQFLP